MVPMERIARSTSPLPRECSATELHGRHASTTQHLFRPDEAATCPHRTSSATLIGAGEGNRTLVVSLEGFCSTIELHPPGPPPPGPPPPGKGDAASTVCLRNSTCT